MKVKILYHGDCDTPKGEIAFLLWRIFDGLNEMWANEIGPDFLISITCSKYPTFYSKEPDSISYVSYRETVEEGRLYVQQNTFEADLQIPHSYYKQMDQVEYLKFLLDKIYALVIQAEPKTDVMEKYFLGLLEVIDIYKANM